VILKRGTCLQSASVLDAILVASLRSRDFLRSNGVCNHVFLTGNSSLS
jgi:hypothetical protein